MCVSHIERLKFGCICFCDSFVGDVCEVQAGVLACGRRESVYSQPKYYFHGTGSVHFPWTKHGCQFSGMAF